MEEYFHHERTKGKEIAAPLHFGSRSATRCSHPDLSHAKARRRKDNWDEVQFYLAWIAEEITGMRILILSLFLLRALRGLRGDKFLGAGNDCSKLIRVHSRFASGASRQQNPARQRILCGYTQDRANAVRSFRISETTRATGM